MSDLLHVVLSGTCPEVLADVFVHVEEQEVVLRYAQPAVEPRIEGDGADDQRDGHRQARNHDWQEEVRLFGNAVQRYRHPRYEAAAPSQKRDSDECSQLGCRFVEKLGAHLEEVVESGNRQTSFDAVHRCPHLVARVEQIAERDQLGEHSTSPTGYKLH